MNERVLMESGLSQNEARIYLALVRMGPSTAAQIIKKIGAYRANTYDALDKLHSKGLISSITKVNVKQYQASPPAKLLDSLREKEQSLNAIMPELEADFKSSKSMEEIQVFKGKAGLRTVMEDILKENKTFYVFGGAGKLSDALKFYIPHWHTERERQRLWTKIIYEKRMKGKTGDYKFVEKRYLKPESGFPTTVGIYGDKVVEFIFGEEPLIVLIRSKKASSGFMEFFNLLWKLAEG
jgi:sugar-specific transcriptional regulator TrmB